MADSSLVQRRPDGRYELQTTPFTSIDEPAPSKKLCADASFYGQPRFPPQTGASGTLVGEDLVLTAQHAMPNLEVCAARRPVFGFALDGLLASSGNPVVDASQVFQCVDIVASGAPGWDNDPSNDGDWAVIRLDRPVDLDRVPVKLRREGPQPFGAPAVIVGHPHRLPLKLELASYGSGYVSVGSSGSMFVTTATGRSEGVVVSGGVQTEYDPTLQCWRECVEPGCPHYVGSTPTTKAATRVPAIGLDVSPVADAFHYGPPGGPFTPTDVPYTLSIGATGRAVNAAIVAPTSLFDVVAVADATPISPGTKLRADVRLREHEAAMLSIGEHTASVTFADRTYSTSDERVHHVLVGVDGFGVTAGEPFERSVTYRVANRWAVDQQVEISVDVAWLSLDGQSGPIRLDLPATPDEARMAVAATANAPHQGTGEITFRSRSNGQILHTELHHVYWSGEALSILD